MLGLLVLIATASAEAPLTETEREAIDRGETIYRVRRAGRHTHAFAAVAVEANRETIWREVLNYDAYARRMPYVTRSSRDLTVVTPAHTEVLCTMEVTVRGIATTYRVRNLWYPSADLILFQMEPNGWSALEAASGVWRVEPYQQDKSLLTYSLDLTTAWYVPSTLRDRAARGLPRVARAIARAAEAAATD